MTQVSKQSLRVAQRELIQTVNKGHCPFVVRPRECLLDILCPDVPIIEGQERKMIMYSASNVDGGAIIALGIGVSLSNPRPRPTEGIDEVAFGISL